MQFFSFHCHKTALPAKEDYHHEQLLLIAHIHACSGESFRIEDLQINLKIKNLKRTSRDYQV